jgi:hypothetical protein
MIAVISTHAGLSLRSSTFEGGTGDLCLKLHFGDPKNSAPAHRQRPLTLPNGRVTISHNERFRYRPISMTLAHASAIQSP